jgi:circularin A/uberolysin family circular bacteriocin
LFIVNILCKGGENMFELIGTFGVNAVAATKIVNAIEAAGTVWGIITIAGTVIASAGIGAGAIGVGLAMFKAAAKKVGKKAARKIVVSW